MSDIFLNIKWFVSPFLGQVSKKYEQKWMSIIASGAIPKKIKHASIDEEILFQNGLVDKEGFWLEPPNLLGQVRLLVDKRYDMYAVVTLFKNWVKEEQISTLKTLDLDKFVRAIPLYLDQKNRRRKEIQEIIPIEKGPRALKLADIIRQRYHEETNTLKTFNDEEWLIIVSMTEKIKIQFSLYVACAFRILKAKSHSISVENLLNEKMLNHISVLFSESL